MSGEGVQEKILTKDLEQEMKESYLSYAMSVIVGRALPDIRDGLKPVQRRILYSMHGLHVRHNQPHKKCARIVGETMGKYHPHGDSAIYDALVRMGQNFSLRYPHIDAQGNFGSIDGDPPAAMRYTEARFSRVADYLLMDIEKDTVNFFPNFDNSLTEPEVLPSVLPNLLINGASGIAVGMATNLPPHNLVEIVDAIIYMLDNPGATIKELHKIVKGPDFPTGGIICGKDNILQAYEKGRGKIILRGKSVIEHHNNRDSIIITEIPYQVNKANLIGTIVSLINGKKIEGISDLRDESDKEGIRIVIELKRDAQAQIVLNQLYKHTQMETTFGIISLALVNSRPQILNLKEMMSCHIRFRKEVITRRTSFELEKARRRAHILEGFKIALKFLDEVVNIIKKSKTPQDAKTSLMKKFSLTDIQAQSILEMQLQRLCALERKKIEEEYLELLKKMEYYQLILSSERKQEEIIKEELGEIKEKFSQPRRTEVMRKREEIEVEDLIVEEDVVITVTASGYIKRQPVTSYRQQMRGGRGVSAMTTKDQDFVEHLFISSSKETLLIFTSAGKTYTLKTYEIPLGSRISKGRAIVNILNLSPQEKFRAILAVKEFNEDNCIVMSTERGFVKRTRLSLFSNVRKSGIYAITLTEKDQLKGVAIAGDKDNVILATKKGMSIKFSVGNIRPTGRQSQGVKGITLKKDDYVIGMVLSKGGIKQSKDFILTATDKGFGKRTLIEEYRTQSRGGKGVTNIKLSSKLGEVVSVSLVSAEDELMCITNKGILIRVNVKGVRQTGRATQGVKIINLTSGDKVCSIFRIVPQE